MFTRGLRVFSRPFVSRNTRFQPSVVLSARLPQTTTTAVRTMSSHGFGESTVRPQPDKVLQDIADYVHDFQVSSDLAWETARLCLIDTVGCGLEGLRFPECNRLMGPVVPGTVVPNGITLNYSSRYIKLMIRKVQKFLARISSWTPFGVPSTLGP
jgi:2-methylcitrate dehydratase